MCKFPLDGVNVESWYLLVLRVVRVVGCLIEQDDYVGVWLVVASQFLSGLTMPVCIRYEGQGVVRKFKEELYVWVSESGSKCCGVERNYEGSCKWGLRPAQLLS